MQIDVVRIANALRRARPKVKDEGETFEQWRRDVSAVLDELDGPELDREEFIATVKL